MAPRILEDETAEVLKQSERRQTLSAGGLSQVQKEDCQLAHLVNLLDCDSVIPWRVTT